MDADDYQPQYVYLAALISREATHVLFAESACLQTPLSWLLQVSRPSFAPSPQELSEVDNFGLPSDTALAWFDFTLTFTTEVQRIWRRKFSGATVVYLVARYTLLLDSYFLLTEAFLWRSSGAVRAVWALLYCVRNRVNQFTGLQPRYTHG